MVLDSRSAACPIGKIDHEVNPPLRPDTLAVVVSLQLVTSIPDEPTTVAVVRLLRCCVNCDCGGKLSPCGSRFLGPKKPDFWLVGRPALQKTACFRTISSVTQTPK